MSISAKVRAEVMERDRGECQFWCGGRPATEISHRDHQGIGGLPPDHWKNQPGNLAASCGECHRRVHQAGWNWVEFQPGSGIHDQGVMRILGPDGSEVPREDLWFYTRWIKEAAVMAAQSLQTVSTIDNTIGEMMYDLRRGSKFLGGAKTFDEHVSGLGWDPLKANEIADVFEWTQGLACGWPAEVNYSKMQLLHGIDWADISPIPFVESAAGGDSYSTIRDNLIRSGLVRRQFRIYALISPPHVGAVDIKYVRTYRETELVQWAAERGLAVVKVNSFKGALKYRRGKDGGLFNGRGPLAVATFDEVVDSAG